MNVYPVLVTPAIVPVVHISQGVSITRAVIDAVSLYQGFQMYFLSLSFHDMVMNLVSM